jgi:hypothetical protein
MDHWPQDATGQTYSVRDTIKHRLFPWQMLNFEPRRRSGFEALSYSGVITSVIGCQRQWDRWISVLRQRQHGISGRGVGHEAASI